MPIGNNLGGGGAYFNQKDYLSATALLIEAKKFQGQVPHPTFKKPGTNEPVLRNIATADVTVFATPADFTGEPKVLKGVQITATYLALDLEDHVDGDPQVARVVQVPNKNGGAPSWRWRPVPEDIHKAVSDFYDRREEGVKAALEGETPEWLR